MDEFLPKEVREGLAAAREKARRGTGTRLRVRAGGRTYPVLRLWKGGFALDADAPRLRGLVDMVAGGDKCYQCLVVASAEEGGEIVYEFKWNTRAVDEAPLDFPRDEDAPAALLEG